jgi:hypothetical protein
MEDVTENEFKASLKRELKAYVVMTEAVIIVFEGETVTFKIISLKESIEFGYAARIQMACNRLISLDTLVDQVYQKYQEYQKRDKSYTRVMNDGKKHKCPKF